MKHFTLIISTALLTILIGMGTNVYAIPAKGISSDLPLQALMEQQGQRLTTGSKESTVEGLLPTKVETASLTDKPKIQKSFGQQPMYFEPNLGQADDEVKFTARGKGYTLFLTETEAVFSLQAPRKATKTNNRHELFKREEKSFETEAPQILRMQLGGDTLNKKPVIKGLEKQSGISNYILGNDKSKWRTGVPHYRKVEYEDVYPGIDLVYYGNPQQLEYDFVVEPGANPDQIQLAFAGADEIQITDNGNLNITINQQQLDFRAPIIYQVKNGKKQTIAGKYVIKDGKHIDAGINTATEIGFQLASYDKNLPLVIDPVLEYSTYLGGSDWEHGLDVAVDENGHAYLTGVTDSTDFPTAKVADAMYSGNTDGFVTQLDSAGKLVYSTYLGGSGLDWGDSIAIDANGHAYVTGATDSTDVPTINATQATLSESGNEDLFVIQLDRAGQMVYSTYLGGSSDDGGNDIAVGANGHAYVTGATDSTDFPTTNAVDTTLSGGTDAFVTQLDSVGQIVYSTYLGGNSDDRGNGIAVDANGHAYVTGFSTSTDFPNINATQATLSGDHDMFVTQLDRAGQMVYSTYLGGSASDYGVGVTLDANGHAYVTGSTASTDFPTINASQATLSGYADAFVSRLDRAGQLVYSTYLGGSRPDAGHGIVVDANGNVYLAGETFSPDFPIENAFDVTLSQGWDAFVTQLDSAGGLVFSTFLGGNSADSVQGIALDDNGHIIVTGFTESTDFPTVNAEYWTLSGDSDVFVTKITALDGQVPTADSQNITTAENTPVEVTLTGTDPDGRTLNYTILSQPVNGTLAGKEPDVTYTPNTNFNGTDSFTFKVDNGELESFPANVTIIVGTPFTLESFITSPTEHEIVSLPLNVQGNAVASAGVNTVLVGIRDQVTNLWWNNGSWGVWILNPANTTPTGDDSVDWNYDFDPTGTGGSGRYRVFNRVRDLEGNLSESTALNFNAEVNLQAVITSPRNKQEVNIPVTISGTGMAPAGVQTVLIGIRDQKTNLWWNNGLWGEWILNPVDFTSSNDTAVKWSKTFDPTGTVSSGEYRVFARVRDVEGVLSGADSLVFFTSSKNPVQRISVSSEGNEGNAGSSVSESNNFSEDGRLVVFTSQASNLVDGDYNDATDVFIRNLETNEISRINETVDTLEINSGSSYPMLSGNGRYVVFASAATNLVENDTNELQDIFLFDRETKDIQRINVSPDGSQANEWCSTPEISGNGRYISYSSAANNLVNNDNVSTYTYQTFIYDREENETSKVCVSTQGAEVNDNCWGGSMSYDGRFVAFHSIADNLVEDDINGDGDVFIHDRVLKETKLISVSSTGEQSFSWTLEQFPKISQDGHFVTYMSEANDLVGDADNNDINVFLYERETGVTTRVSVSSDGEVGDWLSFQPAINADGRYIAFSSLASNLVNDDTNDKEDIFVHDRITGKTTRIISNGTEGNNHSSTAQISPDGRFVMFNSIASNLVDGDFNNANDVFVAPVTFY